MRNTGGAARTRLIVPPSVVTVTDKRFARANVRVTLRQLKAANVESPSLAAWMAAHERPGEIDIDEDEERHRHHR